MRCHFGTLVSDDFLVSECLYNFVRPVGAEKKQSKNDDTFDNKEK